METLKNLVKAVLGVCLLLGLGFWGGSYYQKEKDYAYFNSVKPVEVHTKDTLWLPLPVETANDVPSTIVRVPDASGRRDTTHFIARGDTVTFSDSAKIAPTYYYPENRFSIYYAPPPRQVITDSVYVEKVVTIPVEEPISVWKVAEYVGIGVAAGIIVDKVLLNGNR